MCGALILVLLLPSALMEMAGPVGVGAALVAWLSLGFVTLYRFRCGRCQNPAFRYRAFHTIKKGGILVWGPFPKKQCGVCGFDLTADE